MISIYQAVLHYFLFVIGVINELTSLEQDPWTSLEQSQDQRQRCDKASLDKSWNVGVTRFLTPIYQGFVFSFFAIVSLTVRTPPIRTLVGSEVVQHAIMRSTHSATLRGCRPVTEFFCKGVICSPKEISLLKVYVEKCNQVIMTILARKTAPQMISLMKQRVVSPAVNKEISSIFCSKKLLWNFTFIPFRPISFSDIQNDPLILRRHLKISRIRYTQTVHVENDIRSRERQLNQLEYLITPHMQPISDLVKTGVALNRSRPLSRLADIELSRVTQLHNVVFTHGGITVPGLNNRLCHDLIDASNEVGRQTDFMARDMNRVITNCSLLNRLLSNQDQWINEPPMSKL